jgi:type I restriction enzyme, S subunit
MTHERVVESLAAVCFYINRGAAPSYIEKRGLLVLNQKCIRDQRVNFNEARRTDSLAKPVSPERFLKLNDILVNSTGVGTLGRVAQILELPEPATVDSHVTIVRADPTKAAPRYLGFALRFLQPAIEALAEGSTGQTELARARLGEIAIPLPLKEEQHAIASVLGTLDDKIELNRRMNETLKTLARSVFHSWFVNFDTIRANGGSFLNSTIGRIPKGWKVERFDKHITADRGLSYKGEGLRDDGTGLPMHNLNSVYEGGGYKHEGIKYYAGEHREKHLLQPGDMIVTNTEQGFDHLLIGYAAIVPKSYGPKGLFSHHIYRVRHKPSSPFSPHYLVELFNNPRWHYWISGFSNGTTINMLPKDALEMPQLVVPPGDLVRKFTALATAVHAQVEANLEESSTLAALRDALLPKLLSGELRVSPQIASKFEGGATNRSRSARWNGNGETRTPQSRTQGLVSQSKP